MATIPEKGELGDLSLPRLLLQLHAVRFDGTLRLCRDRLEKSFLFQQGAPISAESSLPSETLGLWLLDSGRIDREGYLRMSAHVAERKVREGVALLELGLIDPKGLFVALKEQVRMRLVDCFGWPRGRFEVAAQATPPADAQPFRADLYAVIQEGIETHWSADRMLAELRPRMDRVVARNRRTTQIQDRLRSDASVEALLGALDGTRTFWRALQCARTPRAMAAAWLLDAVGALDAREPEEEKPEPLEAAAPVVEIVLTDEVAPAAAAPEAAPREAPQRGMDEVLVLEISQKYVALDELDHYRLLGLEPDAPPAAIKRAYLGAAKHYHPDALARAGLDRETREKAGRVFGAIGKAHAVLSDPKRRQRYDASLGSDETDLDAERLAAAETNYRKGEILMRQGNFRGALDFLRPAVELWPEDGTYQGALGWSLFKARPPDPARARQHLERAYELEPRNAEVVHRLSLVLKALGEVAAAANLAAKARELDPSLA